MKTLIKIPENITQYIALTDIYKIGHNSATNEISKFLGENSKICIFFFPSNAAQGATSWLKNKLIIVSRGLVFFKYEQKVSKKTIEIFDICKKS